MVFSSRKYNSIIRYSFIYSLLLALVIALLLTALLYYTEKLSTMGTVIIIVISMTTFCYSHTLLAKKYIIRRYILSKKFPRKWESILESNVKYYQYLSDDEKIRFKQEILIFLGEKKITGIETDVDDKCKILVASSAIIPVFNYQEWEYNDLSEILIYPGNFDENYNFMSKNSHYLGLVTRKGSNMILSKAALYMAFEDEENSSHVGIHEFIHKIDGKDGFIDGIPFFMLNKNNRDRWLEISQLETDRIRAGQSDINPYALTNKAEFFAVVSEYFFKQPSLMENQHPELYGILEEIFERK